MFCNWISSQSKNKGGEKRSSSLIPASGEKSFGNEFNISLHTEVGGIQNAELEMPVTQCRDTCSLTAHMLLCY